MDILELKNWIITVSKIKSLEKETGWQINVKVPYKETTLEEEEFKLYEIKTRLDEVQSLYDIQAQFVKDIKAL